MSSQIKRIVIVVCLAGIAVFFGYRGLQIVRAETSGTSPNSPDSGVDSRLTTASATVSGQLYGSDAAGTWGDWGAKWNRIYSAAIKPFNDAVAKTLKNGGNASYPKTTGGVDDYNNGGTTPVDSYQATWVACDSAAQTPSHPGGNYCGTGRSVAEKMDLNTGLVWSPRMTINGSTSPDWFTANNCQQSADATFANGAGNAKQATNCSSTVLTGCTCITLPTTGATTTTGCAAYDSASGWRLPTQKELMMSYIDGSWASLSNASYYYWSSTTYSYGVYQAWYTSQYYGATNSNNKVNGTSARCVR